MSWSPAITLLAVCNAVLLIAIALAPMLRRQGLRTWKRRQARSAARVRAELQAADAGARLVTLIHDSNEGVTLNALDAIGRAPTTYSAALVVVARLVAEAGPRVRVTASWVCLRILGTSPETQEALRHDPSPDIRVLVVRAATLDRRHPLSPAAQRVVIGALDDPEPAVRYAAVIGLTRVPCAPLVPPLIQRLSDPVLEIRLAAARLVGLRSAAGDDVALCRMLSGMDRQASRVLLAALPRRDQPPRPEVLAIASNSHSDQRTSAIRLLATTSDPRARRTLAMLLSDQDSSIRHESAAAAAASARIGYPRPLDPALVDRLLHRLAEEPVRAIVADVIDALAYSLDPRVPAAFLRQIPSSRGSVRERLVESGALFAQLVPSAERRRMGQKA